jgi:hypothetical protein
MALHTVSAHLDGNRICPDKQVNFDPKEKLWIIYATPEEDDSFREDWGRLGSFAMAALYERDEKMTEKNSSDTTHSDSKS